MRKLLRPIVLGGGRSFGGVGVEQGGRNRERTRKGRGQQAGPETARRQRRSLGVASPHAVHTQGTKHLRLASLHERNKPHRIARCESLHHQHHYHHHRHATQAPPKAAPNTHMHVDMSVTSP